MRGYTTGTSFSGDWLDFSSSQGTMFSVNGLGSLYSDWDLQSKHLVISRNGITGNFAAQAGAGGSIATGAVGNVLIGSFAGSAITTTDHNICIGDDAGRTGAGASNTFLGTRAGYNLNGGNNNICVGPSSGEGGVNAGASNSIFLGASTGFSITSGEYNIAIGEACGYSLTTGSNNVFLSDNTGYNTSDGLDNFAVGRGALYANVSGDDIIALGESAGRQLTGTNANQSIIIGKQAGYGQNGLSTYSDCIFLHYDFPIFLLILFYARFRFVASAIPNSTMTLIPPKIGIEYPGIIGRGGGVAFSP